jgi:hypothetical protein
LWEIDMFALRICKNFSVAIAVDLAPLWAAPLLGANAPADNCNKKAME